MEALASVGELTCDIESESSLLTVRRTLRGFASELGMGLVDETKLVTAASELARNALQYAGKGVMLVEKVEADGCRGVRAQFEDNGPGIANLELALRDNWTSGGGLGMGLPGARRLVDEFEIDSVEGRGTTVRISKWVR